MDELAERLEQDAAGRLPALDLRLALAVIAGGALGSVARAELSVAWAHDPAQWPWATFVVNLLGAAALGALVVRTAGRPRLHGLLGTGFCGGLTTFSTFQLEVLRMLDAGHAGLAAGYVAASVACGLAVAAGAARLVGGGAA